MFSLIDFPYSFIEMNSTVHFFPVKRKGHGDGVGGGLQIPFFQCYFSQTVPVDPLLLLLMTLPHLHSSAFIESLTICDNKVYCRCGLCNVKYLSLSCDSCVM